MPKATPSIKVRNVSRLGAKVVLFGQDFDEAKLECARLAETHGLVFVPPYDDPLSVACMLLVVGMYPGGGNGLPSPWYAGRRWAGKRPESSMVPGGRTIFPSLRRDG